MDKGTVVNVKKDAVSKLAVSYIRLTHTHTPAGLRQGKSLANTKRPAHPQERTAKGGTGKPTNGGNTNTFNHISIYIETQSEVQVRFWKRNWALE